MITISVHENYTLLSQNVFSEKEDAEETHHFNYKMAINIQPSKWDKWKNKVYMHI